MGALFQPVRQRVRGRIDRRFYPEFLVGEDSPTLRNVPIPSSPSFFAKGRYEAKDFLGESATKRVYVVHDREADRDVAFALVKTEGIEETERLRVEREAEVVSNLGEHPNIVPIYEFGEDRGHLFMVMPVMTGGTVNGLRRREKSGRLGPDRTVSIAADVCKGLDFAHGKGVIHRDLKPGNVFLGEDGEAKIGDFGIALSEAQSRITRAGTMVGTPAFMSPEQGTGAKVDYRTDLYSLGAMLYELVAGRPPFSGDHPAAIISQHVNTPPVPPTIHNKECPEELEELILALLAKESLRST